MAKREEKTAVLENVSLTYRNFAGKEGMYNKAGARNFAVILTPDMAEAMLRDGWVVKTRPARVEGDDEQHYISVTVKFSQGGRPPRVVLISSKGRTTLDEADLEVLDWVDIQTVDLIIRPYEWEINGRTGTRAYLKSIYVTIREDELELKYSEIEPL
jgi:hypothetical protein